MTSLPPPVVAKSNRWATIALFTAILSLGSVVVAFLAAFGIPYRWVHDGQGVMLCQIGHCCVSAVFNALALAGLIMGVTAVVQCRASKGAEKGLGAAYTAVVLSLSVFLLCHVAWLLDPVLNFALMRMH